MHRIIFTLFVTLCFSVVNAQAMTLHVLWITAKNEKGSNDLHLRNTMVPSLEVFGEDYIPLEEQGHQVNDHFFGEGKDCPLEKNAIIRYIANLSVGSDDAVMVYYRGHGGYGNEDEGKKKYGAKQYYQFMNDKGSWDYLPHAEVRLAVEKLNPRLAVFIRDCCGAWISVPTRGVKPEQGGNDYAPMDAATERRRPRREQKLFLSLFVNSRGVVDIASAKEGFSAVTQVVPEGLGVYRADNSYLEATETYTNCGTIFSNSFDKIFDINRSRGLSWSQFFGTVTKESESRFQRANPDSKTMEACGKHTPHGFVIGGIYAVPDFQARLTKSKIPSGYFGFEGEPVFGGVRLTRVDKGSRAEAYGLEANKEDENGKRFSDIIYAVDDIPVTTNEELDLACQILGDDGKIKFTLINGRDGKVQDFAFPDIRGEIVN